VCDFSFVRRLQISVICDVFEKCCRIGIANCALMSCKVALVKMIESAVKHYVTFIAGQPAAPMPIRKLLSSKAASFEVAALLTVCMLAAFMYNNKNNNRLGRDGGESGRAWLCCAGCTRALKSDSERRRQEGRDYHYHF
jgi:hypothetical protein